MTIFLYFLPIIVLSHCYGNAFALLLKRPLSRNKFVSFLKIEIDDFTSSSELLQITSPRVFDAQIPPETIYSLGGVTSLLFLTAYVWWTIVIPQQRTKLAVSKSRGKVKDFLDSISPSQESDAEASSDSRKKFLRWVFADWLQRRGSGGRVKDPALPFLKKSKWNSGDNPILVAFGAIMACVIAASIAERSF